MGQRSIAKFINVINDSSITVVSKSGQCDPGCLTSKFSNLSILLNAFGLFSLNQLPIPTKN